jgi:transcriptional regulator with XRE-family HTH domain
VNAGPKSDNTRSSEWSVLGTRLRHVREYLSLSQVWVSEQTGIPRTSISEIERGSRRVDSLEMKKLARLYRYPISYFLDEDLDAVAADHAVTGLARRLTSLKQADLDQVMKFAAFLEMSAQADAESEGQATTGPSGGESP